MSTATILHVSGVEDDRDALAERFEERPDVDVISAPADDVLRTVASTAVDCVVTAFDLGDRTGLDLIDSVRTTDPDVGCILYTDADPKTIRAESNGSVTAYVRKDGPDSLSRLERLVETTATRRTQTAYPLPSSEDERLRVLDRFDTSDDALVAAVDRITELAAWHFDVPMATVNVVAERSQSIVGWYGIELCEMDRQDSLCTYTILNSDVTVLEDVREDPRFDSKNIIEDDEVRFYAGTPIRSQGGHPVGTLCVFDLEPGAFADADATYLELLGRELEAWFHQIETASDAEPRAVSDE
jgi:CheY-like chemotaxis protein